MDLRHCFITTDGAWLPRSGGPGCTDTALCRHAGLLSGSGGGLAVSQQQVNEDVEAAVGWCSLLVLVWPRCLPGRCSSCAVAHCTAPRCGGRRQEGSLQACVCLCVNGQELELFPEHGVSGLRC